MPNATAVEHDELEEVDWLALCESIRTLASNHVQAAFDWLAKQVAGETRDCITLFLMINDLGPHDDEYGAALSTLLAIYDRREVTP